MDKQMPVSAWQDWEIIEKIGEGSFGKVYKAQKITDEETKYSAIKILTIPENQSELESIRSEAGSDEEVKAYFRGLMEECIGEVRTMLQLHGESHIVCVEDCRVVEFLDDIGWEISIRMEYLTSFTDYCMENPVTEEMVIQLGIDVCEALEHCSEYKIIHRDIKPENIFVSDRGEFKLGDFGIARQLERTMTGMSKKGTFSYMAPEVYRGESYDSRADLYSLGVVLYKLRNRNRMPFINLEKQLITYRDKENALTRRMSGEVLAPPVEAGNGLSGVILKACAYRAEDRFSSAAEMKQALEDVKNGKNILPAEPVVSEQPVESLPIVKDQQKDLDRERKINRFLIGVASVAGLALFITLGLLAHLLWERSPKKPDYDEVAFERELNRIQNRATVISNELAGYNWVEDKGNRIQYFDSSWQLMKVLVYPQMSHEGVYEEYFYWYGKCFFAYIWTDESIDYYYFDKDGNLIRWIDQNDVCHDYETRNAEFEQREERYWNNSVEEMERVQNGISN